MMKTVTLFCTPRSKVKGMREKKYITYTYGLEKNVSCIFISGERFRNILLAEEEEATEHKVKVIDEVLDGAIHYREKQGNESPLFHSYFKNYIIYMKGSIFNPVDKEVEPRLYAVSQLYNITKVWAVDVSLNSLSREGAYIFHHGKKISVWSVDSRKRFLAETAANKMRTHYKNSQKGDDKDIFQYLVMEDGSHPTEAEVQKEYNKTLDNELTIKSKKLNKKDLSLFRISDEAGQLEISEIETDGTLDRDMLESKDTFLIKSNIGVYVWIGSGASEDEQTKWLEFADRFIHDDKIDLPIVRVLEKDQQNCESFQELFTEKKK